MANIPLIPLCSIVVPVYNGERFIHETIESCFGQTERNIEIIAIDDASTDNSWNFLKQMSDNNSALILVRNKVNLGISKTLNIGADRAKGKYILFLGQDDLLDSRHIESMISEFRGDTAFVHCNAEVIDQEGRFLKVALDDKSQLKKSKNFMVYSSFSNVVSSTGTIISKKHFDMIGGWNEKYKNYGEWQAWIRLASLGSVKYSTKIRAKYRRHDTNITNTFEAEQVVKDLEKYKGECRKLARENIHSGPDICYHNYIKYRDIAIYGANKVKNWKS